MLYFFYIFNTNSALIGWRAQAVADLSAVYQVLLYGLGSLMAYITIVLWIKKKVHIADSSMLFVVWLLTALVLSFTNLITSSLQWFFFASVPVAYLSYKFIEFLEANAGFKLVYKGRSVVSWVLLLMLVIPTVDILFLIGNSAVYMLHNKEEYHESIIPSEDMECYEWLRENADNTEIILANNDIGNIIPFVTNSITFIGHQHETLDYANKLKKVELFLDGSYSEQEAIDFLNENKIKYIISNTGEETGYKFLTHIRTGRTIILYKYTGSKVI
jgi:hypothetical protein